MDGTFLFVGPDGKPLANVHPHFEILARPGAHRWNEEAIVHKQSFADAAYIGNVDRKHYWNHPGSDAEGRVTLPDLIPGALYRLCDDSTLMPGNKGIQVRKDFTVQPGETLDLGDILVEKPHKP
jgi:hypothetical protein